MKEHINVYISPISGALFPVQLAMMLEVEGTTAIPAFMAGSSGGCIASYIYLASDGSEDAIDRICKQVNSSLLTTSWFPSYLNFLPPTLIGFFKGSIYKKGTGNIKLMENIFTPYNISRIEIFTGTTERKSGKCQIFSNRSASTSIMKDIPYDYKINNSLPILYNDSDIKKIAQVCTASASVPIIVPDEDIDGKYYIDGGTTYSSPLTPLEESLDFIGNSKKLHVIYFNSTDLETSLDDNIYHNLIQNTDSTLERVIKSLAVQDRLKGIDFVKKLVYRNSLNFLYFEGSCNKEILKKIEAAKQMCSRSFLELYTPLTFNIDITNFDYSDIKRIIASARSEYNFRFWCACKNKYNTTIKNIFANICEIIVDPIVNSNSKIVNHVCEIKKDSDDEKTRK
jgi:hypothetical protein